MSSEFMFDEFLSFANRFNKTLQEETFIVDVMNQLGNLMIHEVKEKTPVGQYKDSVFFARDGRLLVFQAPKTTKQGGELRRNWVLESVQSLGDSYVVKISNNTEYAGYVENGHRKVNGGWVEGQFFLKLTLEEITSQLPNIVGPAYEEYLKGFGFK